MGTAVYAQAGSGRTARGLANATVERTYSSQNTPIDHCFLGLFVLTLPCPPPFRSQVDYNVTFVDEAVIDHVGGSVGE